MNQEMFPFILFFSANLIFIVTNFYGWLLKRFYVPMGCKEHFTELYPAQRIVASLYLIQLFEIPYLLDVGNPELLFYVNGVSLMIFTSIMNLVVNTYFFMKNYSVKAIVIYLSPIFVTAILLILPVFKIIHYSDLYLRIMFGVVICVALFYFYRLFVFRHNILNLIKKVNEEEYSNTSDFSLRFAAVMRMLVVFMFFFLLINFIINDVAVKFVRDLIFIALNVWFSIYTLNPHRTMCEKAPELVEKEHLEAVLAENGKFRLTQRQCKELEKNLVEALTKDQLFLEEHITMGDLALQVKTNKNYLSEVISRSEYKSFYNLINTFRIEYACEILAKNPEEKLEQVAYASGFSSGSSFSQIFKRFKHIPPTEYVKSLTE